jgi:hypothetical protein
MVNEQRESRLNQCLAAAAGELEPTRDGPPRTVPDHVPDGVDINRRPAEMDKDSVHCSGKVRSRVNKRPVKVEEDGGRRRIHAIQRF